MFDILPVNRFLDGSVERMVEDCWLVYPEDLLVSGLCFGSENGQFHIYFLTLAGKMSCKDAEFLEAQMMCEIVGGDRYVK